MPPVFQYGSNCDEVRLNAPKRLVGDALYLGRAQTLDEYEIAFDVWSQTNACAASNLVPVVGTGRRSWGVLYEIPADLIRGKRADGRRTLAQIEGSRYEERPIRVRDTNGVEIEVTTFLVKPDEQRSGLWTSFDYVQHIVNGLRAHEVPEEYVQRVIDIAIRTNTRTAQPVTEQTHLIETLRQWDEPIARSLAGVINAGFNSFIYHDMAKEAETQGLTGQSAREHHLKLRMPISASHPPLLVRAIRVNLLLVSEFGLEDPRFTSRFLKAIDIGVVK